MPNQEHSERRKLEALEKIWEFMAQVYGNLWIKNYGVVAGDNQAWMAGLTGLSMNQILQGLEKVATNGKTFPPTLPEFIGYCKNDGMNFDVIFDTCIHWSDDSALEVRQLEKTREVLFIMRNFGAELIAASNREKAERIVRRGIEKLTNHVRSGGDLPEFPVEIEHKRGPVKGICFAAIWAEVEA